MAASYVMEEVMKRRIFLRMKRSLANLKETVESFVLTHLPCVERISRHLNTRIYVRICIYGI